MTSINTAEKDFYLHLAVFAKMKKGSGIILGLLRAEIVSYNTKQSLKLHYASSCENGEIMQENIIPNQTPRL